MKKIISFNFILILILIISVVYYFTAFTSISDNVIRLHIIPNSNSTEDIAVKHSVREEILSAMRHELDRNSSRSEIISSPEKIEVITNNYLAKNNIAYHAAAKLESTNISRKSYDGITMPSGKYTAIRVVLGEGDGENWWCVAYPPLCFTEEIFGQLSEKGDKQLKEQIGKNGYRIISNEIKYELKIVELAEKFISKIQGK